MKKIKSIVFFITILTAFSACEKWVDPNPDPDPRIFDRKYCNDPLAVNYNWDFPGVPDSTVCIFPSDLFEGSYRFKDSIFAVDNQFDSANSQKTYIIQLIPTSKNRMRLVGFCTGNDLLFTAERSSWRSFADTTIKLNDTTFAFGQPLCRTADTLTGNIIKSRTDDSSIVIEWTVVSDTGINYHKGTAIKQ